MAQLLLVDDDRDLTWTLAAWLRREGYGVTVAGNGLAALDLARRLGSDLMILDVALPCLDGLQVCRRVRSDPALASLPILFLSGRGTVPDRVLALESGGDDYLVKPFDFRELRARVETLLRRTRPSAPPVLEAGPLRLDARTYLLHYDGRTTLLTDTQFRLLAHLMRRANQVCSERELLRQVWGSPSTGADLSLVRWHIKKLRERIEPDPAVPRYLRTVPRHGYVLAAPAEPPLRRPRGALTQASRSRRGPAATVGDAAHSPPTGGGADG